MKIVCDNCATKYQIADEKVSGKAFKIRCKKCGHVIVVNKGAGDGPSQAPAAEASVNQEAPPPAAEAPTGTDAVWHLVIDREQVGPMTPDEVRGKVRGGQADSETYGWREGFDDWLKLSAIEDFKSLFPAGGDDQATRRTDSASRPGAAAGGAAPGADLFSGGADQPVRTAAPGAATIVSDGLQAPDLAALGLSSPLNSSAPSPMAASAPMAAPAPLTASAPMAPQMANSMDAPVKSMAGARSENSVLFSLNNLSALAGSGGGGGGGSEKPMMPSPQSEASGLIDIRAMAAATLGVSAGPGQSSSRMPDLPFGGSDAPPVFTPLAPAVLMPSNESSGVPKWVFALVGVGVLMFVGMIVVLVVVLKGDSGSTPVATNTPTKDTPKEPSTTTTPTKEPGSTGTNIVKEPTTAPNTKPAATDNSSSKPSSSEKGSDHSSKGSSKREPKEPKEPKATKESKPDKSPDIPSSKPDAPPPPPKKEAKPKAKDDLDSLLDNASSGSGGKPSKAEKKDLPEQLSMDVIKSTLKGVNVASCKDSGASGVVQVKMTIKGSGKVSDASPSGGAAGGDCVAGKVKSAKFPEFSGDPMTLTFPFIVR